MLQPVVLRVRTYELDSFGHVNNATYLNYLEEARSEFLRQLDLSFNDFASLGIQLVIVEAQVRYLSPARYGESIAVAGRFRDVRAASLTIEYDLTEQATGRRVATAWTRGAFIHAMTGKPTRAPKTFHEAFAHAALSSTAFPDLEGAV